MPVDIQQVDAELKTQFTRMWPHNLGEVVTSHESVPSGKARSVKLSESHPVDTTDAMLARIPAFLQRLAELAPPDRGYWLRRGPECYYTPAVTGPDWEPTPERCRLVVRLFPVVEEGKEDEFPEYSGKLEGGI